MIERHIEPGMAAEAVAEIDRRLADVAHHENVVIPIAIESGSRAWGFPSPDSDYDCRFVFVRTPEDTFSLFPKRDVIETPLTELIDVNGWELCKALRLMLKGNAVLIEWLKSPVTYQANQEFRSAFLNLAEETANPASWANHYLHLANSMRARVLQDPEQVPLKKLFYLIRPVAAARWIMEGRGQGLPPMRLQSLMADLGLDGKLRACLDDLIGLKLETRELGTGKAPEPVMSYISEAIPALEDWLRTQDLKPSGSSLRKADEFHRTWVAQLHSYGGVALRSDQI